MPSHRPPKLKSTPRDRAHRDRTKEPPPLTIGDVLGEAIDADRAVKARRAELNGMGFTPIKTSEDA